MSFPKLNALTSPAYAGFVVFRAVTTALLFLSVSVINATEKPYGAVYSLEADGMLIGKLERSLRQTDDGSFVLNTRSYATGFWKLFISDTIAEESRFTMADGKVIPQSYHYMKKNKGKRTEERVAFNSDKGTILSNFVDGKQSFPFTGIENERE